MALLPRVTCPHCWAVFETHKTLWIAEHPTLVGDPKLGPDVEKRFIPTRFRHDALALDEKDQPCHRIACPACHLELPRAATELESWIVSIIGAPAAGKSFFLGGLIHMMRRVLPNRFQVSFTDGDTSLNRLVNSYEQAMFANKRFDQLIPLGELIPKTQEQGDLYNTVYSGNDSVIFPKPFTFIMRPEPSHPHVTDVGSSARLLCLYDNAGESYLPAKDTFVRPVTRHLAKASLLLFLFDPTQDHDFRVNYVERHGKLPFDSRIEVRPQQTILTEAANRVRQFNNIPSDQKHDQPLFVVVTKQDVWGHLVLGKLQSQQLLLNGPTGIACVNLDYISQTSDLIKSMLKDLCPAVVNAAEAFSSTVIYVGASALGSKPETNEDGQWAIRPNDIKPTGLEAPLLYGLNQHMRGLFPSGRLKTTPM
ncbi:MAG: hypothetical protein R3B84_21360 [Zavarzinella sp.]